MQGWIKLHRDVLNWEWLSEPKTFSFFIYCLIKASHKDFEYRGKQIPKGGFWFGLKVASVETGLSIQSIRTCIKRLKSTNEITVKVSTQGSVITINNWNKYQGKDCVITNEQQTSNKRSTTYKNVKNVKNVKNNNTLVDSNESTLEQNNLPLDNDSISRKNSNTQKQLQEKQLMQDIVEAWNVIAPQFDFAKVKILSDKRAKKLKVAIKQIPDLMDWKRLIFIIPQNPWNRGENDNGWTANFDWLIEKERYVKNLESFYADDSIQESFNSQLEKLK